MASVPTLGVACLWLLSAQPLLEVPVYRYRANMANHFTEMCSGSETVAYLRLIDSCITQLKAQGPSRTCNESKEECGTGRDRSEAVPHLDCNRGKGVRALISNTVELIPTLGALFPRGGPVQDPVLTAGHEAPNVVLGRHHTFLPSSLFTSNLLKSDQLTNYAPFSLGGNRHRTAQS